MAESVTRSTDCGVAVIGGDFKFKAINEGFRSIVGCENDSSHDASALFANVPGLQDWLNDAVERRSNSVFKGRNFTMQFLPLYSGSTPLPGGNNSDSASYVLAVSNNAVYPGGLTTEKIRRIQHDIKNQLGGLKLYTNFLKKRLAGDAELIDVIDKMITIVGTITEQVGQFRQGEEQ